MYTCEKCGHVGFEVEPLGIQTIEDWQSDLDENLKQRMLTKFKNTVGVTDDGVEYVTLYLAKCIRNALFDEIVTPNLSRITPKATYIDNIVPVLNTINKNFEILGVLAPPSSIKLAVMDLTQPEAVFCFVTVMKTADTQERLNELNLPYLLVGEGRTDTLTLH
jgi:hypothetical protein